MEPSAWRKLTQPPGELRQLPLERISVMLQPGALTCVDHLLQTFGADSMQTAQKFGFPTVRIVAVVADFTFQLLQGVNQRAAPGLHLNKPQRRLKQGIWT